LPSVANPHRPVRDACGPGGGHSFGVAEHLALTVVPDAAIDPTLREAARALCLEAFGGEFSADDWDHSCGGVRVVLTEGSELVAHVAVVDRRLDVGGRVLDAGYVEAVAVAPDRRRQGMGRQVMELAASHVRAVSELGVLSTSRQSFYEPLGWERWLGPSFVRGSGRLVRTADEDAGLMALRFGPSAGLDLSSSITCESRIGDDW